MKKDLNITDFPMELIQYVGFFLPLKDLNSFRLSCKSIKHNLNDQLANKLSEKKIKQIATTHACTFFIREDGDVLFSGRFHNGTMSVIGNKKSRKIVGLSDVASISANSHHVIFVKKNGSVVGFGINNNGQLGLGDTIDRPVLTSVPSISNIVAAAIGNTFTVLLNNKGNVFVCGNNRYGHLGIKENIDLTIPTLLPDLSDIIQIAAGDGHMLFLKSDGTVYALGSNNYGQLGLGDTKTRTTPVQIPELKNIKQIACGCVHSIALRNDGRAMVWGENDEGQLGLGHANEQFSPTTVPFIRDIIKVVSSDNRFVLLEKSGVVYMSKIISNSLGSSFISCYASVGLSDIADISAGARNYFFIKKDGAVCGFGDNELEQLGVDKSINTEKPVLITSVNSWISQLEEIKNKELDQSMAYSYY